MSVVTLYVTLYLCELNYDCSAYTVYTMWMMMWMKEEEGGEGGKKEASTPVLL